MVMCAVIFLASVLTLASCSTGEKKVIILSAWLESPALLAVEIGTCAGDEARLEVSENEQEVVVVAFASSQGGDEDCAAALLKATLDGPLGARQVVDDSGDVIAVKR